MYQSEVKMVIGSARDRLVQPPQEVLKEDTVHTPDDASGCGGAIRGSPSSRDDRTHFSLQRSKSDVRHESRLTLLQRQQQAKRRGSNFELAFLLERGRTLDAKLFGQDDSEEDDDDDDGDPRVRRGSADNVGIGKGGRILLLPFRLRQALTKRRFSSSSSSSRLYPPRTSMCGSLQGSAVSISGPLDSLPELAPAEMRNQIADTVTHAQRVKDIDAAIAWLQQEIRSLKQQDRKLFHQLLGLGTEIHRMSGMETCQSCSNSLDLEDIESRQHIDITEDAIIRKNVDLELLASIENDVANLKNNKLVDLYTSFESFFR